MWIDCSRGSETCDLKNSAPVRAPALQHSGGRSDGLFGLPELGLRLVGSLQGSCAIHSCNSLGWTVAGLVKSRQELLLLVVIPRFPGGAAAPEARVPSGSESSSIYAERGIYAWLDGTS